MRYTERHGGVAVIKDKSKHKEAMEKLAEYEDLEEQGLLLKLPCKKDELINVLAKKLLSTEFGNCYMCTNPMKNITLDGINNGCDGMCNASDSATVDDFLKKIIREIEAQAALEKMKGDKAKQYVLVSQGIEIYRTTDKEEAERMMNESNAKHYEYLQRCADEGERPADNMVYMHEEE